MDLANLILEYLKVLLSAPVVTGIVAILFFLLFREDIKALLLRIAKIRFPGGAELSTSQSERQIKEEKVESKGLPSVDRTIPGLPANLGQEERRKVEEIVRAERATAYVWEYRYLNYFLVYATQRVLDWLISLGQSTTYNHFDTIWLPLIPSANERSAIISALQAHHLVQVHDAVIEVTPKGREYQQWRGPLPDVPPTKAPTATP